MSHRSSAVMPEESKHLDPRSQSARAQRATERRREPANWIGMALDRPDLGVLGFGLLAILFAVPAALLIHAANEMFGERVETTLVAVAIVLAALAAIPIVIYVWVKRHDLSATTLGLLIIATLAPVLVSTYLYWVSFYVRFPADILMFAESDFVNDIVKLRVGYPIYSAQQNNESLNYTPGAPLLTYSLAWLSGNATSIPVYRAIQVAFSLLAAAIAALTCRRILEMSMGGRTLQHALLWGAIWLPILFLIATNSLTNPFVHNLHNDSLAQLVSVIAYWLLVEYGRTRDKRLLPFMALLPALGFMAKQSHVIWAAFYCGYLLLFDPPRSLGRVVRFGVVSFGAVIGVIGILYFLWREDFVYWVFYVLIKHTVSPIRAFDHAFQVWVYYAVGMLGGAVLLRDKTRSPLLGLWLIWLGLLLTVTWTSGLDGMLNHIGAGSLLASVWFLAALARMWPVVTRPSEKDPYRSWLQTGIAVASIVLLVGGLGLARIPLRPFASAPYEYVGAIEGEFAGYSSSQILLDMGTWVYMDDGVIMKDRAMPVTERGYSETGDFSGILQRLQDRHYAKILVHDLDAPYFWYEYFRWRTPSGIKRAMLDNYTEVRRIPAVPGSRPGWLPTQGFGEISVLVPKAY